MGFRVLRLTLEQSLENPSGMFETSAVGFQASHFEFDLGVESQGLVEFLHNGGGFLSSPQFSKNLVQKVVSVKKRRVLRDCSLKVPQRQMQFSGLQAVIGLLVVPQEGMGRFAHFISIHRQRFLPWVPRPVMA